MDVRLPTFAAILSLAASVALGQPLATSAVGQEPPKPVDGQQLISKAAENLAGQRRLEANIRQKIHLFGQELSGPGYYAQYGRDDWDTSSTTNATKLHLKLSLVAGQHTIFQQVCDGRFLYTQFELPDQKRVAFIDLQRVHKSISKNKAATAMTASTNWMALGGLPNLLRQLNNNFRFGPVKRALLGKEKVPVWQIMGTWKPARLAELLPAQRDAILAGRSVKWDDLPKQLPHSVALTLARDNPFPLFPYRIVFNQFVTTRHDNAPNKPRTAAHPVLTLEFYNVRHRANMSRSEFHFKPDDQELLDDTEKYLQQIGAMKRREATSQD